MPRSSWFDALTVVQQQDQHAWLATLPSPIERIANFGCLSGSEPFALLWTLNAKEVTVIDIEAKFLQEIDAQTSVLQARCPESLRGRVINQLCRDMTTYIPELRDDSFDLAYCSNVLYALPLQGDPQALDRGVDQMVRILKPGGFLIAVEPKFGAQFQTRDLGFAGIQITVPIPISEATDMAPVFASNPLLRYVLPSSPPNSYCYRKLTE